MWIQCVVVMLSGWDCIALIVMRECLSGVWVVFWIVRALFCLLCLFCLVCLIWSVIFSVMLGVFCCGMWIVCFSGVILTCR